MDELFLILSTLPQLQFLQVPKVETMMIYKRSTNRTLTTLRTSGNDSFSCTAATGSGIKIFFAGLKEYFRKVFTESYELLLFSFFRTIGFKTRTKFK